MAEIDYLDYLQLQRRKDDTGGYFVTENEITNLSRETGVPHMHLRSTAIAKGIQIKNLILPVFESNSNYLELDNNAVPVEKPNKTNYGLETYYNRLGVNDLYQFIGCSRGAHLSIIKTELDTKKNEIRYNSLVQKGNRTPDEEANYYLFKQAEYSFVSEDSRKEYHTYLRWKMINDILSEIQVNANISNNVIQERYFNKMTIDLQIPSSVISEKIYADRAREIVTAYCLEHNIRVVKNKSNEPVPKNNLGEKVPPHKTSIWKIIFILLVLIGSIGAGLLYNQKQMNKKQIERYIDEYHPAVINVIAPTLTSVPTMIKTPAIINRTPLPTIDASDPTTTNIYMVPVYPLNSVSTSIPYNESGHILFEINDRGKVCNQVSQGANLRTAPTDTQDNIKVFVDNGRPFTILDGPFYGNGKTWWYVRVDNIGEGYMAESTSASQLLCPL